MADTKNFLSADAILAIPGAVAEEIEVPEWGGWVKVKPLSKSQQLKVRKSAVKNGVVDSRLLEGLIFVEGVVHPKTEVPLFDKSQIDTLFSKPSAVIDRLLGYIMDASGMTEDAEDDAEEDLKS